MARYKWELASRVLALDAPVLWSDPDIVLFRNPLPYLVRKQERYSCAPRLPPLGGYIENTSRSVCLRSGVAWIFSPNNVLYLSPPTPSWTAPLFRQDGLPKCDIILQGEMAALGFWDDVLGADVMTPRRVLGLYSGSKEQQMFNTGFVRISP